MLFNSYPFILVFLPIALFGFFALARRNHALAAGWLTFVSLVFYAWWNPAYVGLLIGSVAFNYVFGMQIARANAAAPRWFGRLPVAPCEVRAVEPYQEKEAPPAFYQALAQRWCPSAT